MLILDIFASRANSSEGKLQVELAQLKYRLHGYQALAYRSQGLWRNRHKRPGETKLETDRRHIRRRISKLNEELKELENVVTLRI